MAPCHRTKAQKVTATQKAQVIITGQGINHLPHHPYTMPPKKTLELDVAIKLNEGLREDEIVIHANRKTIAKIKGIRLTLPEHYSK